MEPREAATTDQFLTVMKATIATLKSARPMKPDYRAESPINELSMLNPIGALVPSLLIAIAAARVR